MCGIGGIISFNKLGHRTEVVKELCRKLLIALQSRGTNATGMATISFSPYSYNIIKDNVIAENFVRRKSFEEAFNNKDIQIIMLHTRATTRGSEKFDVNNHPHLSKQSNSLLIHNGMIHNYDELKSKYDLQTDGDCDSEIILKMIEKFGFNKGVKQLEGSKAIGLMDGVKQEFVLYRDDHSPLVLTYLPNLDIYIFASTLSILESVLNRKELIRTGVINFIKSNSKIEYGVKTVDDYTKITFDMLNQKVSIGKVEPYIEPYKQKQVYRWSNLENSKEEDIYV